jgi:uncharacterized protein with LGFP repeats
MDHRMTRTTRFAPTHHTHHTQPAQQGGMQPARLERAVSWSDFRTAVRYDPGNRLLIAVPAISAKRAEHAWLGDAVTVHTQVGEAEVYRREYERGTVYWSQHTGAHEVHGEIAARWRAAGGEASLLGLPTTDELRIDSALDANGAPTAGCSHFEGGSIYWSARHGAAVVHGMVRDIWALLGWERSTLGLPVADVRYDRETGAFSGCFEHGSIEWSPAGGPVISVAAPAASDDLLDSAERDTIGRLQADFAPRG